MTIIVQKLIKGYCWSVSALASHVKICIFQEAKQTNEINKSHVHLKMLLE